MDMSLKDVCRAGSVSASETWPLHPTVIKFGIFGVMMAVLTDRYLELIDGPGDTVLPPGSQIPKEWTQ
jgi:hypothetical protein